MHIELDEVSKRFGSTHALRTVSLNLPPSSVVAVLGENGAGKSTLLRMLAGILVPDKGLLRYDGKIFTREDLAFRKRVLFTPDTPLLFEAESVASNIATYAGLYDVPMENLENELTHWLVDTGVVPLLKRPVGQLSRGQQWKTAMACVAAVKPELWLVDEPFASGMDAIGIGSFRRLARHLTETGSTVIYTTQLVELAADFSDYVCVLGEGTLVLFERSQRIQEILHESPNGAENILRGLRDKAM